MKTLLNFLLLPFTFSLFTCFAQNLVPNPSFEEYDTCPNNWSQCDYVIGWKTYRINPDYFNLCSQNINFAVPKNFFGFQQPANGNAYIGLYCRAAGFTDTREYIGCTLINHLIPGNKYYISFKVNVANTNQCFTNNIGILFSTQSYSSIIPAPITNYSHLHSSEIITDTLNWTIIKGSFIADSNYQYVMIGNFYDDSNTDTIMVGLNSSSYFYIDDVCVSIDSLTCNQPNEINEINNKKDLIKIFPNPAKQRIFLVINEQKGFICKIYNIYGKLYRKYDSPSNIDVSNFPNGIYIFQINVNEKNIYKKIIINH